MFCENCGNNLSDNVAFFCEQCGRAIRQEHLTQQDVIGESEEIVITEYFKDGYPYDTILKMLKECHNINISLRTLKRRLKHYGLNKNINISLEAFKNVLKRVIKGPRSSIGYRNMQKFLYNTLGIRVPRNIVMITLREIDSEGVLIRRSRKLRRRCYRSNGPNDVWHVDGYDKLKPYGLPIHGAIDGFSRKILWLKVCRSNNNPNVPAKFFIQSIRELGICPRLLRTDCGTENGIMAGVQCCCKRIC